MASIEPLPSGANSRRAKTIWELAPDIAGNPDEPYYGNRDESATRLGLDVEPTPRDVPLHPGAARWYREHGVDVSE